MTNVGVDILWQEDGTLRVRRIARGDDWFPVEQGRQWQDDAGRHVLLLLPDGHAYELVLSGRDLTWQLAPVGGPPSHAV